MLNSDIYNIGYCNLIAHSCMFFGSLVLAKDTKEFHIHFGLLKGFDISGSFFEHNNPQEHQQ